MGLDNTNYIREIELIIRRYQKNSGMKLLEKAFTSDEKTKSEVF